MYYNARADLDHDGFIDEADYNELNAIINNQ